MTAYGICKKGGAMVDLKKLEWLNFQHKRLLIGSGNLRPLLQQAIPLILRKYFVEPDFDSESAKALKGQVWKVDESVSQVD